MRLIATPAKKMPKTRSYDILFIENNGRSITNNQPHGNRTGNSRRVFLRPCNYRPFPEHYVHIRAGALRQIQGPYAFHFDNLFDFLFLALKSGHLNIKLY